MTRSPQSLPSSTARRLPSPSNSNSHSPPRRLPRSRSSSPSRRPLSPSPRRRSRSPERGRLPTSSAEPSRSRSRSWSPGSSPPSASQATLSSVYKPPSPPPPPSALQSSLSSVSQSPTAPSPSPQAAKKRTLYMLFSHAVGEVRHSLYTLEIPDPLPLIPSKESHTIQLKNPKPLAPTLLFPSNEFSHLMCCVQLDSKLYFLGGELPEYKERKTSFPPTVYIFEPTAAISGKTNASDFLTECSCMKTGKNEPIVFVAFGKIYALSAPLTKLKFFHLDCFEVFDPTIDT